MIEENQGLVKTCRVCREVRPLIDFYRDKGKRDNRMSDCKQCSKLRVAQYRQSHRERMRELDKLSRARNAEKLTARRKAYYADHSEDLKRRERERYARLKDEVYRAYGGYVCNCCGESEPMFLNVDHVNNDGYAHRKEVHPRRLYYWLKVNGFPEGFQILCSNCNLGKKLNGGVCPHWTQDCHGIEVRLVGKR